MANEVSISTEDGEYTHTHKLKKIDHSRYVYEKYNNKTNKVEMALDGGLNTLVSNLDIPVSLLFKAKKSGMFLVRSPISTSSIIKVC